MSLNHAKGYADAGEAARSKAVVQFGHEIVEGCPCGEVHTARPGKPKAALKAPARDTGPSMEMRAMVFALHLGCCVRCGHAVGEWRSIHHRQRRSQFGPNEFPNLLLFCGSGTTGCHGWVHQNVTEAETLGYLVRSKGIPARIPVLVMTPDGPAWLYYTEDGDRVGKLPEGVAAA